MNIFWDILFVIFLTVLLICTIIEIALAGGFDGLLLRQSFPWLIAGWCIWIAGFYAVRKMSKGENDYDRGDEYF